MNHYPLWKNAMVVVVILLGTLFALPNFYGEDPALIVSKENGEVFSNAELKDVENFLASKEASVTSIRNKKGDLLIRFPDVENQIAASSNIRSYLGRFSTVALTFAPRMPEWIQQLDLNPMSLGLDLRGGVYFKFEVDLDAAIQQRLDQYITDINKSLIYKRIRRSIRKEGNTLSV